MANNIHQGRNIKRFRELLGLKQEGLAYDLGDDWTQKRVSLLESKKLIDEDILELVAKALKVPVQAIENLTEDGAINIIANTFQDFKDNAVASQNYCTFNLLDEWKEGITENKRLQEENKRLYERLLQVEKEKNEWLQRLLAEKK